MLPCEWERLWLLLLFTIATTAVATTTSTNGYYNLTPAEFYQRVTTGNYDVIIDVRTKVEEWDVTGHIPGATLVESLASYLPGNESNLGTPADLAGCE